VLTKRNAKNHATILQLIYLAEVKMSSVDVCYKHLFLFSPIFFFEVPAISVDM
jgi:hypothetical protein